MTPRRPRSNADGPAHTRAGPSASRRDHLRVVGSAPDYEPEPKRDETFRLVQQHLQLANRLGVGPLTVTERARSLLASSCIGWRRNGQCVTQDLSPCAEPHEACLLAQYHHDLLLLEHGLLGPVPRQPAAVPPLAYSATPSPQGS